MTKKMPDVLSLRVLTLQGTITVRKGFNAIWRERRLCKLDKR
jgi:hypothetical protein